MEIWKTLVAHGDQIEVASFLATTLGIPLALLVFVFEKHKSRMEGDLEAFNSLETCYADYLAMCMAHPKLDLYYEALPTPPELDDQERIQQYALFEILVDILERAYSVHFNKRNKAAVEYSQGWIEFIAEWCMKERFQVLWGKLGTQYWDGFTLHINETIAEIRKFRSSGIEPKAKELKSTKKAILKNMPFYHRMSA